MESGIRYNFSGKVWKHSAEGGWYFVSLPSKISSEIREHLQWQEEGWGRMKATATIGTLSWDTAIWFDKKHQTYLLPLKADIRRKTGIKPDDIIDVMISL